MLLSTRDWYLQCKNITSGAKHQFFTTKTAVNACGGCFRWVGNTACPICHSLMTILTLCEVGYGGTSLGDTCFWCQTIVKAIKFSCSDLVEVRNHPPLVICNMTFPLSRCICCLGSLWHAWKGSLTLIYFISEFNSHQIGLLLPGHEELVRSVWRIYRRVPEATADQFRRTYSQNIQVLFLGIWCACLCNVFADLCLTFRTEGILWHPRAMYSLILKRTLLFHMSSTWDELH